MCLCVCVACVEKTKGIPTLTSTPKLHVSNHCLSHPDNNPSRRKREEGAGIEGRGWEKGRWTRRSGGRWSWNEHLGKRKRKNNISSRIKGNRYSNEIARKGGGGREVRGRWEVSSVTFTHVWEERRRWGRGVTEVDAMWWQDSVTTKINRPVCTMVCGGAVWALIEVLCQRHSNTDYGMFSININFKL